MCYNTSCTYISSLLMKYDRCISNFSLRNDILQLCSTGVRVDYSQRQSGDYIQFIKAKKTNRLIWNDLLFHFWLLDSFHLNDIYQKGKGHREVDIALRNFYFEAFCEKGNTYHHQETQR